MLQHPVASKWKRFLVAETRKAGTLKNVEIRDFFNHPRRAPPQEAAGPVRILPGIRKNPWENEHFPVASKRQPRRASGGSSTATSWILQTLL